MQSALDAFRAQREAADQVHARLTEVAQLLNQLTKQVDAVAGNADLRAILRDERDLLHQAQILLVDVRHFRELRVVDTLCVIGLTKLVERAELADTGATEYRRWRQSEGTSDGAPRPKRALCGSSHDGYQASSDEGRTPTRHHDAPGTSCCWTMKRARSYSSSNVMISGLSVCRRNSSKDRYRSSFTPCSVMNSPRPPMTRKDFGM
jgi:hypothetical protein